MLPIAYLHSSMSLVKLWDAKLIYRNLLWFYNTGQSKREVKKQSHSNHNKKRKTKYPTYHCIKKNKIIAVSLTKEAKDLFLENY